MRSRSAGFSVFATHTLTVHKQENFYESVGLDAQKYDREVIRKTNNISAKTFLVVMNVDHPQFFL